jgi:hypothetical protein
MDAPLVVAYSNLHLFFLAVLNRTEPEFSDNSPISWKSRLQMLVTLSSNKAKYMSALDTARKAK